MVESHSANFTLCQQRGPLLLLSEDEVLCWRLLVAREQGRETAGPGTFQQPMHDRR